MLSGGAANAMFHLHKYDCKRYFRLDNIFSKIQLDISVSLIAVKYIFLILKDSTENHHPDWLPWFFSPWNELSCWKEHENSCRRPYVQTQISCDTFWRIWSGTIYVIFWLIAAIEFYFYVAHSALVAVNVRIREANQPSVWCFYRRRAERLAYKSKHMFFFNDDQIHRGGCVETIECILFFSRYLRLCEIVLFTFGHARCR